MRGVNKSQNRQRPGGANPQPSRVISRRTCRSVAFLHNFSSCQVHLSSRPLSFNYLNLDLLETVLPEDSKGGDTILTEVNQDVPRASQHQQFIRFPGPKVQLTWHRRPWTGPS